MGNSLRRVDKLKVRILPTIIAPKCPVLVDQRIQIKVKNLRPFQNVTNSQGICKVVCCGYASLLSNGK